MNKPFEEFDKIIKRFEFNFSLLMKILCDYCMSKNSNYKNLIKEKNKELQNSLYDLFIEVFKKKFSEIEDFEFDFSSGHDLRDLYKSNMPKLKNKDLIIKDARYFFDYLNPCVFVDCSKDKEVACYKHERFSFMNSFTMQGEVKKVFEKISKKLKLLHTLLVYEKVY